MKILLITGPPYSGKGTQCELLEDKLGYVHVSVGERIRTEKANGTKFGLSVRDYEERGELVPDSMMSGVLLDIFTENKDKNIILDGFPRTIAQVDALEELLDSIDIKLDMILNIEVPSPELIRRAKKRAETSDRKDDKDPRIHFRRLEIFEERTRPAIEYLRSKFEVTDIDGTGTKEKVTNLIKEKINL